MNSKNNLSSRLAVLALVVGAGAASAYGCSSSNNNNPTPSSNDSGSDGTMSTTDSSSSSSSGGSTNDAPVIDTGSCMPDASAGCNACYTASQAQQDPLNGCAPETVNCIPFTATVPTHPTL